MFSFQSKPVLIPTRTIIVPVFQNIHFKHFFKSMTRFLVLCGFFNCHKVLSFSRLDSSFQLVYLSRNASGIFNLLMKFRFLPLSVNFIYTVQNHNLDNELNFRLPVILQVDYIIFNISYSVSYPVSCCQLYKYLAITTSTVFIQIKLFQNTQNRNSIINNKISYVNVEFIYT